MDTDGLDLIMEDVYSDNPPENWETGFTEGSAYKIMKDEIPFQVNGQWFVYVWDKKDEDITVFSFAEDRGIEYNDFHEWLNSVKKPVERSI